MKKILLALLPLSILMLDAKAQQQTTPVLNEFPLMVTLKVKDIATAISIPESKQLTLAVFFQKEESLMAAAGKNGITAQASKLLQDQLKQEYEALLTPLELKAYSLKRKGSIYAKSDTTTTTN